MAGLRHLWLVGGSELWLTVGSYELLCRHACLRLLPSLDSFLGVGPALIFKSSQEASADGPH